MFCPMRLWNKLAEHQVHIEFSDAEVSDSGLLNMEHLTYYQTEPINALKEALLVMISHRVMHNDLRWEHVALLPKHNVHTGMLDLKPVLLDLTRIVHLSADRSGDDLIL